MNMIQIHQTVTKMPMVVSAISIQKKLLALNHILPRYVFEIVLVFWTKLWNLGRSEWRNNASQDMHSCQI